MKRSREKTSKPARVEAQGAVGVGDSISSMKGPESFLVSPNGQWVERAIALRNGTRARTRLRVAEPLDDVSEFTLAHQFDRAFLVTGTRPSTSPQAREIRMVDLFSGCGAMSLGIWEACRAVGARAVPVMALDSNEGALRVYEDNFPGVWALSNPVESVLDGVLGSRPTIAERALIARLGRVEVLLGGPPCQGHSNLNNYTRRADPKNQLYDRMARLAELVEPTHVIIENVSAVRHDKGKVVDRTLAHLRRLNYSLDDAVVEAVELGVPQRRRRHFVVASQELQPDIGGTVAAFSRPARNVNWAIGDLGRVSRDNTFDRPSTPSAVNRERIDYLFTHNLFELPDEMRPDCHRLAVHTYKSVYGRLRGDTPAQTITSGFLSMGQGRNVHPTQPRTVTPHEAARLQFIPDFFDFRGATKRTALAEMIGNAVPSKLAYVLGVELLR